VSVEYNTSIDLTAAQVVFNDSDLAVWQVPGRAKQVLASRGAGVRMRSQGRSARLSTNWRGIDMISASGCRWARLRAR
jgi:hypothetical protein